MYMLSLTGPATSSQTSTAGLLWNSNTQVNSLNTDQLTARHIVITTYLSLGDDVSHPLALDRLAENRLEVDLLQGVVVIGEQLVDAELQDVLQLHNIQLRLVGHDTKQILFTCHTTEKFHSGKRCLLIILSNALRLTCITRKSKYLDVLISDEVCVFAAAGTTVWELSSLYHRVCQLQFGFSAPQHNLLHCTPAH